MRKFSKNQLPSHNVALPPLAIVVETNNCGLSGEIDAVKQQILMKRNTYIAGGLYIGLMVNTKAYNGAVFGELLQDEADKTRQGRVK